MAIRSFFRMARALHMISPLTETSDSLFTKYVKIAAVVALYWYVLNTCYSNNCSLQFYPATFKSKLCQFVFYRFVSIITVFVNKALLSGDDVKLDAPLFVTWVQCIVSVVICLLLGLLRRTNLPNPSDVFTSNTAKMVRNRWKTMINGTNLDPKFTLIISISGAAGSRFIYSDGIDK